MSVALVIAPSLEASFRNNYSVYAGLRQLQQQISLLLGSNPALAGQPTTISVGTVSPNSPVGVSVLTPATSAHPGACVRFTLELSTSAHVLRTALAEAAYTLKEQLQLVSVLQHALASWSASLWGVPAEAKGRIQVTANAVAVHFVHEKAELSVIIHQWEPSTRWQYAQLGTPVLHTFIESMAIPTFRPSGRRLGGWESCCG